MRDFWKRHPKLALPFVLFMFPVYFLANAGHGFFEGARDGLHDFVDEVAVAWGLFRHGARR